MTIIISFRFIIINLLFAIYAFYIEDLFLEELLKQILNHKENYLLGVLLFLIQIIEIYALHIRKHVLANYYFFSKRKNTKEIQKNNSEYSPPGLILLWIFHTLVSVVISMSALGFLGFPMTAENPSIIAGLAMFAVVIKEIAILIIFIGIEKKDVKKISGIKEFFTDLLLFIYSATAFTATWLLMASTGKPGLGGDNIAITILYSFISALLFFMFYLPVNMSYILEDLSFLYKKYQAPLLALSLVFALAMSLYPLYKIPVNININVYYSIIQKYKLDYSKWDSRTHTFYTRHIDSFKNLKADPNAEQYLKLNLSGKNIIILPQDLSPFQEYESINLSNNLLYSLPANFKKLNNLKLLNLKNNKFKKKYRKYLIKFLPNIKILF